MPVTVLMTPRRAVNVGPGSGWSESVRDVRDAVSPVGCPAANPSLSDSFSKHSRLQTSVMHSRFSFVVVACVLGMSVSAVAQERPYFVTYDHYLEEPGNFEIAVASTTGFPKAGNPSYTAPWLELEYGLTGWWTAELYLEGVTMHGNGSAFTGLRWENRFRPLKGEHAINPVLYVEYERINEGSRIQKEIVGSGALAFEPISELREAVAHELEGKLILSSAMRGWNIAENVIFEKNLSADEGIEFGYSVGVSRSLGSLATGTTCHVCRENFTLGVEAFGGLGSTVDSALTDTRHYIAPVFAWRLTDRSTLKVSNGFGLTNASDHHLLRIGYSYEFATRSVR